MFRYRNRNSCQIVETEDRRFDLEALARWESVEGGTIIDGLIRTEVTELSAETADVEVEKPIEAPKPRTRRTRKPATEVED